MKKGKQKEKFETHVKTQDFYKYYANMYFRETSSNKKNGKINKESKFFLEPGVFSEILDEFNIAIRDLILTEAFEFKMPARMGTLSIKKRKLTPWVNEKGEVVNPLPINWGATNHLWESDPVAKEKKTLVRHYNPHTKGYIASWVFSKYFATFQWKSAYSFIPCRTAKLKLSVLLRDPLAKVDYYLK